MASIENASWAETPLDDWVFAPDYAIPLVENHFGVLSLEGFGLANRSAAASAAGAILHYVRTTQRGSLDHIDRIGYYERQNCLVLDAVTVRNLELIEPLFSGAGDSITLFRCLDCTATPMGKRLLRSWILRPSIELDEIEQRLNAVESMVADLIRREELRRAMEGMLDLERLLSRVTLESANPRDLLALAISFAKLPAIRAAVAAFPAERLHALHAHCDELADLRTRILTTLEDEPPLTVSDGGVIRSGVDAALDELRDLSRNSKQYIAQIEQRERQRTGIGSLKVKFNSVFGYYLEISKANLHHTPLFSMEFPGRNSRSAALPAAAPLWSSAAAPVPSPDNSASRVSHFQSHIPRPSPWPRSTWKPDPRRFGIERGRALTRHPRE